MAMNALFLNCTLKKSPQISNTHVLIDRAEGILKELESEVTGVTGQNIVSVVSSGENDGDEMLIILTSSDCNWAGNAGPGSVAQKQEGKGTFMLTGK